MLRHLAFKIGNSIGCTPWYDLKKCLISQSKTYKMFKIIWIVFYSCLVIFTCYNYYLKEFSTDRNTLRVNARKIIDFLQDSIRIMALICIILGIYLKESYWVQFLHGYSHLHQELKLKNCLTNDFRFSVLTFLLFVCRLFIILFNTVLPENFARVTVIMYNFLIFAINVDVFIVGTSISSLKCRYKDLNCYLLRTLMISEDSTVGRTADEYMFAKQIRDIGGMYKKLRDLVNIYNELFAWKMLFIISLLFFKVLIQLEDIVDGIYEYSLHNNTLLVWTVVSNL